MSTAKGKVGMFREWLRKRRLKKALLIIDEHEDALRAALELRGKHLHKNPRRKVEG